MFPVQFNPANSCNIASCHRVLWNDFPKGSSSKNEAGQLRFALVTQLVCLSLYEPQFSRPWGRSFPLPQRACPAYLVLYCVFESVKVQHPHILSGHSIFHAVAVDYCFILQKVYPPTPPPNCMLHCVSSHWLSVKHMHLKHRTWNLQRRQEDSSLDWVTY